ILVGLDVTNPAKGSFSASADTHTIETGFDLILTDIGNDLFVAEIGMSPGEQLLREFANGEYRKARKNEILKRKRAREETAKKYSTVFKTSFEKLAELLETEAGKAWLIEAAKICKECGNCTKVCPTCVCYTVHDCPSLDGTGERVRERSSCLFTEAAECGGGHNFRGKAEERIKNRLLDKVKFIGSEHKINGCVGCGRCGVCPVGIAHIADVFNALAQEEK
ncbi:MAG: 4Fe-4S dicluster domain-containing protein, partial [Candidatus Paceibacterota bacterium]